MTWLFGPGVALGYLLGLRGLAAWGMAPVIGVALIATVAVGAEVIGLDWSVTVVLAVCAVVALGVGAVARLARRHTFFAGDPDPRGVTLAAAAGLVPAGLLGALTVVRAMGSPDALSQRFDTPSTIQKSANLRWHRPVTSAKSGPLACFE